MTTILITGAGRGIGRELAVQALAKGWRVIGSVRKAGTSPAGVHELDFDVTDEAAIRAAAASLDEPVDILINNSGVIGPARQSTTDMDYRGFALTLDINVLGPLRVTQAFLPHLQRSQQPRVLTVSSLMGSMSYAKSDRIAYRASKAAVNKVMQGLATDLAPQGIAVASLHPGWVKTDMGGQGADIEPQQSAAGILTIAEALTAEQTGRFWNWDGKQLEW